MKIIMDFDDTILNTHALFGEFIEIFEKAGFTKEEFAINYKKNKEKTGGSFGMEAILDLHEKIRLFNRRQVRKEINSVINNAKDFVYEDFYDFADKFDKKDLILLSFGTTDFQKEKIANSQISKFFGRVMITKRYKVEEIESMSGEFAQEKMFFIDDKAIEIEKVKMKLPRIVCMKMERPQGGHLDAKSKLVDYTVKSLEEAGEIITRLA